MDNHDYNGKVKLKLTRAEMNERNRQHKIGSNAKFTTITEMKQHHSAINILYHNGYDACALKEISGQFFAQWNTLCLKFEQMRNNVEKIYDNPY
jgi:transposase